MGSLPISVLPPAAPHLGAVASALFHIIPIESASISYGTLMPRADWAAIGSFEVNLPQICEQRAIAAVFIDMDAELAALERRRDKVCAVKQGMMEQLLTGRVRLA